MTYKFTKERPTGAKGLILLISPYSPRNQTLQDPNILSPKMESILQKNSSALTEEDFNEIGILHSNLRTMIDAVAFHGDKEKSLRDVWLITTEAESVEPGATTLRGPGSEQAGNLLEKYLKFKYAEGIVVHRKEPRGEGLCVKPWDYETLCQVAESIFRNSGFKEDAILADVTGGTKMMSVALAVASVPRTRKMQYMDSMRDWQGNPVEKGSTEPVVIDVDPILYQGE